jgi:hypothetical protein
LIECYERKYPVDMEHKRVVEVVKECVEQKEQDKLSDRYVKQLKYDLDRFADRFKNDIGDVAGRDIDTWLRELGVSGRTRNNIRMSVQTLFGFAKAKRYLPKDHDEMDAVPVAKELDGAIEIFTPAELREVCPFANVTDQIVSLMTKLNHKRRDAAPEGEEVLADGHQEFKWKHNGLRHSFISYRVAAIKNVAQVALEAGNSPAMIFSNYRELVTPQDAEAWFDVYPAEFNRRSAKTAERKNLTAKNAKNTKRKGS